MSDPAERLHKLRNLRDLITGLESLGPASEEFLDWRESLLKTTEETFGNESSELAEVQALNFEPEPEWMKSFKYQITDPDKPEEFMKNRTQDGPRLLEAWRDAGDDPSKLAGLLRKSHFKNTLDQARDLVSAMIYTVDKNQS